MTPRLAILCTHPVQYLVPVHRALAGGKTVRSKVFYSYSQANSGSSFDAGFGIDVRWDIPLLDDYDHEFVTNIAPKPGLGHFFGVQNPGLIEALRGFEPDALLVYGWNYHSHLQVLRHFKGRLPILFRGDSTLLDGGSLLRQFVRRRLLTWVYRHIDLALAVGQNNRDYFLWCGVPRRNVRLVPHSIDVRRFADPGDSYARAAQQWRAELGIDDDALVIGFAGKLQPKKAPDLLLRAFKQLGLPAQLVFFGSGVLETQLRAQAGTAANVHFLPFQNQSQMPVAYRCCDVFVLPSRGPGETWGLALNEAMACGRAVVASTRVGGARDLIQPGINGDSFAAGDLEQLTRCLRSLAELGRRELLQMGAAGQLMSASWTSERTADRIADAVLAVCQ